MVDVGVGPHCHCQSLMLLAVGRAASPLLSSLLFSLPSFEMRRGPAVLADFDASAGEGVAAVAKHRGVLGGC